MLFCYCHALIPANGHTVAAYGKRYACLDASPMGEDDVELFSGHALILRK